MGSFDMACCVSGVSLGRRQPVKMFFVIEDDPRHREERVTHCYPTDMWKFCSFGIDMRYDDYGRYTLDESQDEWKDFLAFIAQDGAYTPKGENPYHEKEFDPRKVHDLEEFFDILNHGRIRMATNVLAPFEKRIGGRRLCPWPVHKRIFDDVIMAPYMNWRGVKSDHETWIAYYKENAKELKDRRSSCNKDRIKLAKKAFKAGKMSKGDYEKEVNAARAWAESWIYETDSVFRNFNMFHHGYMFDRLFKKRGEDYVIRKMAEVAMLYNKLNANRIMVVPTMGAGQDYDYESNIDFHRECAKTIKLIASKDEDD